MRACAYDGEELKMDWRAGFRARAPENTGNKKANTFVLNKLVGTCVNKWNLLELVETCCQQLPTEKLVPNSYLECVATFTSSTGDGLL